MRHARRENGDPSCVGIGGIGMKIAFRADGTKEKGLGHLMRCGAIADAFLEEGSHVVFYSSYGTSGLQWLREKGYQTRELSDSNSLEAEAEELIALLREARTDILFLDSYWLSDEYIKSMRQSGAFVASLDDEQLYHYECDAVINGNLNAEDYSYSDCEVGFLMLGGRYNILRKEFSVTPPTPLRNPAKRILITMGGTDCSNYTPTVLRGLEAFEGLEISVVYGPLMTNRAEIENAADRCKSPVSIYESPSSMAKLMHDSDLAISAGGGTVRELFTMGLVSLFILQADNQLPLKDYLERRGMRLCLGYHTDVSPKEIAAAVKTLLSDVNIRARYREKMLGLLSRDGVQNIVQTIKYAALAKEGLIP